MEAEQCQMEIFDSQRENQRSLGSNEETQKTGYQIGNRQKIITKTSVYFNPTQIRNVFVSNLTSYLLRARSKLKYLRHRNDHEIQPVPWISQECKPIYTEASRSDLYKRLERINSRERVPGRQSIDRISSPRQIKARSFLSACTFINC